MFSPIRDRLQILLAGEQGHGKYNNGSPNITMSKSPKTVTFTWQRDLANRIKLKVFGWKCLPGSSLLAQCNHKDPLRWKQEFRDRREVMIK